MGAGGNAGGGGGGGGGELVGGGVHAWPCLQTYLPSNFKIKERGHAL